MKTILVALVCLMLFVTPALAIKSQGDIEKDTGAMPNEWTYGFKKFGESFGLMFTFNQAEKAELQYEYAMRRQIESNYMNSIGEAERANQLMNEYQKQLGEAEQTMLKAQNQGENVDSLKTQLEQQKGKQ